MESYEDKDLTEKQRTFCEEYVIHCNATKAALAIGIENNPTQSGFQFLKNEHVQGYLRWLRSRAAEVAGVTVVRNAMELTKIAYGEVDKDGNPIEYKPFERIKAIEVLNKMFGLNKPEKVEHTGENGGPIQVTGMVIKKE